MRKLPLPLSLSQPLPRSLSRTNWAKVVEMKIKHIPALGISFILAVALPCSAGTTPPDGILAASVGDTVILIEPFSGRTATFETGPVGWLFPAPGGILFAPDVINARTTVINLLALAVVDRLDGLTMPYFSANADRYTAITDEVVMLSYPDRAVIKTISAEIAHPWQVIMAPDGAAMLILERLPDGSTGVYMTTVNLITNQVVYRRPLLGDIRHFALSPQLGILALADTENNQVHVVEPATLTAIAVHATEGQPIDVTFAQEGKVLATAVATGDGAGTLNLAIFKTSKKYIRISKEYSIPLGAKPVRIASSPGGNYVAVALEGGSVAIVDVGGRKTIATGTLPATPRDLRWCDPLSEGPMITDWSDGETPTEFGTFVPKVRDEGELSGLAEPVRKKPPS
jgi:DNA-binding beta-propeller fold protein YncE